MMQAADWDAYYAAADHPFCTAPATALTNRFASLAPGSAVDLACGTGRHARALADLGWNVHALDFSSVAIELASADGDNHLIDYDIADARSWQPRAPVDLVLISFLDLPVHELTALIARAATWLNTPGGSLLYLGRARTPPTSGSRAPGIGDSLPRVADLAYAAESLRVVELAHVIRSSRDHHDIEVLLHAQRWTRATKSSAAQDGNGSGERRSPAQSLAHTGAADRGWTAASGLNGSATDSCQPSPKRIDGAPTPIWREDL